MLKANKLKEKHLNHGDWRRDFMIATNTTIITIDIAILLVCGVVYLVLVFMFYVNVFDFICLFYSC